MYLLSLNWTNCNDNFSLQLCGVDISLDRTFVPLHCIYVLFSAIGLSGSVLAYISIKGFSLSFTSQCRIIIVLAQTENVVYCHLDCWVLAGRYAWRVLTWWDFTLLNNEDFLSTEHSHGKPFGKSLSEWLSDCYQSCCQRVSVRVAAVRVAAVRNIVLLIGSQNQQLTYSIRQLKSYGQLDTFQHTILELSQMWPNTQ